MIDVSIIVINYNTQKLTSECLRSVIENTKGISYEIVLVDNNSSECDPRIFLNQFPSIRLIRNESNLGFAKANNVGIAVSKGRCVLLLNSDAYLVDDSISILYQQMFLRQDVAIASGKLIFPNGNYQGVCQRFPSFWIFLFEITRFQKLFGRRRAGRILLGSFFDYESEVYPDWVWGTFMMIRRDLISDLPEGKLDEEFFMYCEDIQWCLDFKNKGYRIFYTPSAKVVHLMGGSSADKKAFNSKNFEMFLYRNYNFVNATILGWIYKWYYN